MRIKDGTFTGRGRVVHSETQEGKNVLTLDVIYYYAGPLEGTLTYHGDLERVVVDPITSQGTYNLVGRFDGGIQHHATRLVVIDGGIVNLASQPHPTWDGTWQGILGNKQGKRRAHGTVHGEVIFKNATEFTVQGTYTFIGWSRVSEQQPVAGADR